MATTEELAKRAVASESNGKKTSKKKARKKKATKKTTSRKRSTTRRRKTDELGELDHAISVVEKAQKKLARVTGPKARRR